jgi:hypothetical protein
VETEKDGKAGKQYWDAAAARRPRAQRSQGRQGARPGGHRFAEAEILEWYGSVPGYLGPIGTKKPVKVVADRTVANMADFVCGANEAGYHYTGANWGRDCRAASWPTCATWSPATLRRTARACWRSSAASKWATCSSSAPATRET